MLNNPEATQMALSILRKGDKKVIASLFAVNAFMLVLFAGILHWI